MFLPFLVSQFLLAVFSFQENVVWIGQFVFAASTESIKVDRIGLGSFSNGFSESKIGFGLDSTQAVLPSGQLMVRKYGTTCKPLNS